MYNSSILSLQYTVFNKYSFFQILFKISVPQSVILFSSNHKNYYYNFFYFSNVTVCAFGNRFFLSRLIILIM